MTCSWTPVPLGPKGPAVVPIGVASSYGIGATDLERAAERGVNFFYWGSRRTRGFGKGLARIAARKRDGVVIVIQSYARTPGTIGRSLEGGLRSLGIEYADVLLLGWWNMPPSDRILDGARALVDRGLARQIMISCHHRASFVQLAADPRIDLLMLRYNAAHPGAEKDVFPHLPTPRPGIVAYTTTSWGQLLDPGYTPPGERTPTAADCFRFVLTSPFVDACWVGARHAGDVDQALAALDAGPMSAEELAAIKRVGVGVRDHAKMRGRGMSFADRVINLVSGFGFRSTGEL